MEKTPAPRPDGQPTKVEGGTGRMGRLKGLFKGRRKYIAAAGALLLLALPGVFVLLPRHAEPHDDDQHLLQSVTLASTFEALDRGDNALAHKLARHLPIANPNTIESYSGSSLVLGTVAYRTAELADADRREDLLLLAVQYLEEAQRLGFPEDRRIDGLLMLASAHLATGKAQSALEPVHALLSATSRPAEVAQCHRLLAAAYAGLPDPDLRLALDHLAACLANGEISTADQQRIAQDQVEYLVRAGEFTKAAAVVADKFKDEPGWPRIQLIQVQLQLHDLQVRLRNKEAKLSDQATEDAFDRILDILTDVQDNDRQRTNATRRALYLEGRVYEAMREHKAATEQFDRIRRVFPTSDEGIAAGLVVAELHLREGELVNAARCLAQVAKSAGERKPFSNTWISQSELKRRMLAAIEAFQEHHRFDLAIGVSRRMTPWLDNAECMLRTAEIYARWGETLLADEGAAADPAKLEAARAKLADAAIAWAQLAHDSYATRQFPERLWKSAQYYFRAHRFQDAARMTRLYLEHEEFGRNVAEARLALGQCLYETGDFAGCLQLLQDGMAEFSRHPAGYEARLVSSQAHVELNQLPEAEAILRKNLEGTDLKPTSPIWRRSQLALGKVLHLAGRYAEATRVLEENVARDPLSSEAARARYILVDCYRSLTYELLREAPASEVPGGLPASPQPAQELRELALGHVEAILQAYNGVPAGAGNPGDREMLRGCEFIRAALLAELGRDEQAVAAFFSVINSYPDRPEALDACVQAAGAYRRLHRPDQAKNAVIHARRILSKLPESSGYVATSGKSRAEWGEFLDWLEKM